MRAHRVLPAFRRLSRPAARGRDPLRLLDVPPGSGLLTFGCHVSFSSTIQQQATSHSPLHGPRLPSRRAATSDVAFPSRHATTDPRDVHELPVLPCRDYNRDGDGRVRLPSDPSVRTAVLHTITRGTRRVRLSARPARTRRASRPPCPRR